MSGWIGDRSMPNTEVEGNSRAGSEGQPYRSGIVKTKMMQTKVNGPDSSSSTDIQRTLDIFRNRSKMEHVAKRKQEQLMLEIKSVLLFLHANNA